jgi:predicted metal-dependent peptidase
MQDIASNLNSTIKVLYVDSEFQGEQEIEPDDTFLLEPKGGGGTDFRPAFKWMEENGIEPTAAIYFTDGCCHSFPEEPDFPLLWAHTGGYKFEPPFGEVIDIDF